MIRLKDIAARASVSVMTVSKVLRDAPDISAATKPRVRQLAAEAGVASNAGARLFPDWARQGIFARPGPAGAPSPKERLEATGRAVREVEIDREDPPFFTAGSTTEEGEKAALQMLQENPKATA